MTAQEQSARYKLEGEYVLSIMRTYRNVEPDGYPCQECDIITIGRCSVRGTVNCGKFQAYVNDRKASRAK